VITGGWYCIEIFILRRIQDENLLYLVILTERFLVGILISFVLPYISENLHSNSQYIPQDIEDESLLDSQTQD
jgi:hypothetical protein